MKPYPKLKIWTYMVILVSAVSALSVISAGIWSEKSERLPDFDKLKIEATMTVRQFGSANGLPEKALKKIFGLNDKSGLEKKLNEYAPEARVSAMITRRLALISEEAGKNWIKIPVKFFLWFVFLGCVFFIFRRKKMTPSVRKGLLLVSLLLFGVVMGSDPSPMGTVKDAIVLYGKTGAVFMPRMAAMIVFLLMVFLVNKYICSWGCQLGTLQDLIFRLNRNEKMKPVLWQQFRIPFVVTNTFRVAFFCIFTAVAFLWGLDIIDPVDPFRVYKPAHIGTAGAVFSGILLVSSLFVYRPWCHLFCPFGLAGWLVEKLSRVRISVDYDSCIACERCAAACPSTVMSAILKRNKKTIPDCFSCYTCRDICPTGSVSFSTAGRTMPPSGHFEKKMKKS